MKVQQRIRVLYAEDDEDTCLMTGLLLDRSGIDVESAHTVEAAVQKAVSGKFDVYLLDGRFRDGSGLILCRRLREVNPHVPVVFYSGYGRGMEKKIGLAAGAAAYLVKPDIDKLAPTILELVTASPRTFGGHRMAAGP